MISDGMKELHVSLLNAMQSMPPLGSGSEKENAFIRSYSAAPTERGTLLCVCVCNTRFKFVWGDAW